MADFDGELAFSMDPAGFVFFSCKSRSRHHAWPGVAPANSRLSFTANGLSEQCVFEQISRWASAAFPVADGVTIRTFDANGWTFKSPGTMVLIN